MVAQRAAVSGGLSATPRPDYRPIRIGLDEHVSLFGMTGSGKSTRARMLLAPVYRVIVLDPKHEFSDPRARLVDKYERKAPYQIYRADDDLDAYEVYLRAAWADPRPVTLYVDEIGDLQLSRRNLVRALARFIREGRSRHQRVFMSSQVPNDIPTLVFSQSTHIYAFYMNWAGHREKVEQFTGDGMADNISRLTGHDYYYFSTHERYPRFRAAAWDTPDMIALETVDVARPSRWDRLKERIGR